MITDTDRTLTITCNVMKNESVIQKGLRNYF